MRDVSDIVAVAEIRELVEDAGPMPNLSDIAETLKLPLQQVVRAYNRLGISELPQLSH